MSVQQKAVTLAPAYSIRGIVLLDGDGARIAARYYPSPVINQTPSERQLPSSPDLQRALEKKLCSRAIKPTPSSSGSSASSASSSSSASSNEIFMVDSLIALYKPLGPDAHLFVVGPGDENELLLLGVLNSLHEALGMVLRNTSGLVSAMVSQGVIGPQSASIMGAQAADKRALLENLDSVLLAIDEMVDGGVVLETDPGTVAARATLRNVDEPSAGEQTLSQVLNIAKTQIVKVLS